VQETALGWARLPPRGAATATGLRTIEPARCTLVNFDRCPASGGRQCGAYHPIARAVSLTIDDVAARYPAGDLVALRVSQIVRRSFRTYRQDDVFIVPSASQALYEDLTGTRVRLTFRPQAEERPPKRPAGPHECQNTQRQSRSPLIPIEPCSGCGAPTVPGTWDSARRVLTPAVPLCHACRGTCD
jgi:hypothetical protein